MTEPPPNTGDACCSCEGGRLRVYSSHDRGGIQVQYLDCKSCGAKPENNRIIIEAHQVKKRQRINRVSLGHRT